MELASRASYRGQVTKLVKFAIDYLRSDEGKVNESLDNLDSIEEELQVTLDRLTAAYECLKKANIEVKGLISANDFNKEAETVAEYDDKAIEAITRLKHRLAKIHQGQSQSADVLPHETTNTPMNATATPSFPISHGAVHLHKLQPRKFFGDFKEWVPFWEQYRVLIHENASLSTIDKFNYLVSVLSGKATETLAGLTPTEANYNVAIALLKEEYGNSEKIVDHIMQGLLSIPPVSSKADVLALRRLYTSVLASTRSLSSLGISTTNYFVMLKGVLLRCLPIDLRVDFHRYYEDLENNSASSTNQVTETNSLSTTSNCSQANSIGDGQINCLLKFLKREVESLEKANEAKSNTPHLKSKPSNSPRSVKTALGLLAAEKKEICLFCKADHKTKDCCSAKSLSEKKQQLRNEGCCFRCCKKGHNSRMCKVKGIVCKTCKGRHATSMCDPLFTFPKSTNVSTLSLSSTAEGETKNSNHSPSIQSSLNLYTMESMQRSKVYLQTACAFVSSEISSISLYVRVVMDGGSQLSFVKSSLVKQLNLPIIGSHNLSVIPFGSDKPKPGRMCNKVRLLVRSQHNDEAVVLDAIEVPEICCDVLSMPTKHTLNLRKLVLADANIAGQRLEEGISILIGADSYWQFATGEIKRLTERMTAVNTVLGWTIQGPYNVRSSDSNAICTTSLNVCTCEEVEKFWQLDVLGISLECDKKRVSNDLSFIRKRGERYEVSLPWKATQRHLNNNHIGAIVRLQSLVRKLFKADRIEDYCNAMADLVFSGVAEIAPKEIINDNRIYYLPHRPVYREDKETTKLRIVFDASAHAPNYLSLNDCLEVGANLLPDLLVVLLNFRTGKIGIVSDIEKAFLQILLNESDRDSHRFLWFEKKIDNERNLPAVQIFRMTRVTFGVTCSPFLLAATLRKIIEEALPQYQETCEKLRSSFYVDDLITSVENEESAERIYTESCLMLKGASMKLRKWNCNSENVRQLFSKEDRVLRMQKVLGLRWVIATDELEVDLDPVVNLLQSESFLSTKRMVLKIMAKIFDPFGILGPWTVRLKLLFQNIWRKKLDWDESLPEDLQSIWVACCNDIQELKEIAIPRHFLTVEGTIEFHVFADASQFAFGAAAYAKTSDSKGNVSVHLICAKNRIAPLKIDQQSELTIPKLELTAALIAARLLAYLKKNLRVNITDSFLWTDSQIALCWIKGSEKRWKPYIENRVKEIRTLSDISSWRHCPGTVNPADLLTRGISSSSLVNSTIWFNGPSWLLKGEMDFTASTQYSTTLCALYVNDEETHSFEKNIIPILNCEDFSNWKRLLRVTAYFFRAVDTFKLKRSFQKHLSAEEISHAENYWLRWVQLTHFSEEMTALQGKRGMPCKSKLITLSPFLDDNKFLRVGGRLQLALDSTGEAHPVILPKSSYITKLVVIDAHERVFHAGTSSVLSNLRSKYWVIKGRQLIKNVIKNCFICKVLHSKPASQPFAPLPKDRVFRSRPFEVTGIDFAGPLYVSDQFDQRKKLYILLFTCAAVRAIHIESTTDLTTDSCLLAMRRFIARRGAPRVIYSDNAATFKRASLELRQLENLKTSERFLGFLANSKIKWKFIVERAPWWGGFWERMIGIVKSALRAAIGKATLNIDQLQTLLTEVEGVVNSRPLTYSGDDPLDLTPLTPAHFIQGSHQASEEISYESTSGNELRKQWKERLRFLTVFKKRWFKEYLLQLRSLHHAGRSLSSSIHPGDVVLLEDSTLPRTLWHLGVIEKIFPGRDGKIRACEVRLGNGSVLRRPIQLMYPLEITDST